MFRTLAATAVACLAVCGPLEAQDVLTFEETVARARAQAGAVATARARIAEAEAGVVAVSTRFRENPVVEVGAGPRSGGGSRTADVDVAVSQQFETGGQRAARLAAARAGVDRARADADESARFVVFDAAGAFLAGVAAAERLRLAEEAERVGGELLNATTRRYAAGDIAAIDVNLARLDAARAAALVAGARADLAAALGSLRALLRLPPGERFELRGTLDAAPLPPLATLEAAIDQRPEFVALAADLRAADAEAALGRALARPDLGLRIGYERDESDHVVLGGVTLTLPVFQRGQGTLAAGLARTRRARVELAAARDLALAELGTAYDVSGQRLAIAAALADAAAATLDDNESLGRRSYEAGEMNLMDYLLIRREALETRTLMIDRRLEAARSRLAVDFIAGVLR